MTDNTVTTQEEISTVLSEVRKAYRFLWYYHQSILDTIRDLIGHFEVNFYASSFANRPSDSRYNPLVGKAWDMLPMRTMDILFLNTNSLNQVPCDSSNQDDYLLVVNAVSDTGCESKESPEDSGDINTSETKLSLYLYLNTLTRTENTDWWKLWDTSNYPPHDTVDSSTSGLKIYCYDFDLTRLYDKDAIKNYVNVFKDKVRDRLAFDLPIRQ